jgi:hypothetical protein
MLSIREIRTFKARFNDHASKLAGASNKAVIVSRKFPLNSLPSCPIKS